MEFPSFPSSSLSPTQIILRISPATIVPTTSIPDSQIHHVDEADLDLTLPLIHAGDADLIPSLQSSNPGILSDTVFANDYYNNLSRLLDRSTCVLLVGPSVAFFAFTEAFVVRKNRCSFYVFLVAFIAAWSIYVVRMSMLPPVWERGTRGVWGHVYGGGGTFVNELLSR